MLDFNSPRSSHPLKIKLHTDPLPALGVDVMLFFSVGSAMSSVLLSCAQSRINAPVYAGELTESLYRFPQHV